MLLEEFTVVRKRLVFKSSNFLPLLNDINVHNMYCTVCIHIMYITDELRHDKINVFEKNNITISILMKDKLLEKYFVQSMVKLFEFCTSDKFVFLSYNNRIAFLFQI